MVVTKCKESPTCLVKCRIPVNQTRHQVLYVQVTVHRDNLTPDDGQSRCPKHVECRDKIKFWILDASSCWLFVRRPSSSLANASLLVVHHVTQLEICAVLGIHTA
jgi:hypothetical protein